MGAVLAIHLAAERGGPMVGVDRADADHAGLVGDRWHGSRHRHVSMVASEDLAAAAALGGDTPDTGGL